MSSPERQKKADGHSPTFEALGGLDRVATLMLALGEESGKAILAELNEDEIRQITFAITHLENINSDDVDSILRDFVSQMLRSGFVVGGVDSAERLLRQFLPADKVAHIMEEIRGPAGRNMWEKLSNINEQVLANYLRNEYPQTIAVILSRINPDHAAKVMTLFSEDLGFDVMNRMLRLESVKKEVVDKIEDTLRGEFMASISNTSRRDSHELMAEIFNNFDRQTEARYMSRLDDEYRLDAERIKSLMFTFDDLARLNNAAVQTLLQNIDKDRLPMALKGAKQPIRELILSNMSERASKALKEEMEVMGPVRLKDVDEAQQLLVNTAKDLANRGEIIISKSGAEEEMVV